MLLRSVNKLLLVALLLVLLLDELLGVLFVSVLHLLDVFLVELGEHDRLRGVVEVGLGVAGIAASGLAVGCRRSEVLDDLVFAPFVFEAALGQDLA